MELLPAPHDSNDQNRQPETDSRQGRKRRNPAVMSVEECLVALSALPKLLALGMLLPVQANAIRSACEAILGHHHKQDAAPNRRSADQAGLRQALRESPHFANYLVGLLSDEEIDNLLADNEGPRA